MKKLITLAALFCSSIFVSYAQEDATVSFMDSRSIKDSLMQHLDKEKISTGVLYDRVNPIAQLTKLNPNEEGAISTDFTHAKQAWYELYRAAYNSDALLSLDYAKDIIAQNFIDNKGISLGYIAFDFNSIAPNAFENGALYRGDDSLLYDGEGNPYLNHHITLPFAGTSGVSGDEVLFYLDPRLQLSNSDKRLSHAELTIEGKEPVMIGMSESIPVSIAGITDSLIKLKLKLHWEGLVLADVFELTLENGNLIPLSSTTTDECHSGNTPIGLWSGPSLMFQGYTEAVATQGKGEYKIFYRKPAGGWGAACNNAHKVIRKPIIILDGFDPGDGRHITSYNANGKQVDGIWDLLSYGNNNSQHLGDELREKGFDVIVLNFPKYQIGAISVTVGGQTFSVPIMKDGGADYIERNAMVLSRLIQTINEELALNGSTEKIVVVGPSMGGQIARYSLKYMEDNNLNHNTRLFVSFDSPNHGANIPVGLQSAILYGAYVQESETAVEQYEGSIRSVAAKQMLIHQVTNQSLSQNGWNYHYPIATQNDYFRQTWQNTIDAMGYPTQLRKVALGNGSRNMAWQTSAASLIDYEITKAGGGFPPQGTRLAKVQCYSPEHNFAGKVFYGHIFTKHAMNIYHHITNGFGNLDGVSGGLFDVSWQVRKYMNTGTFKVDSTKVWFLNIPLNGVGVLHAYAGDNNTFIPTVSALGYNNRNFEWGQNLGTNNLVCDNQIPFDNYYTPSSNQFHIKLTDASVKWVMQEIEKGQPNCFNICKTWFNIPNDVTTPLCLGSSRTFYHNYFLPTPGMTVTWEYSNSILQLISSNNNSITIKALDHGPAFVKAIIHNPCGANVEEKIIFASGAGYSFTVSKYDITSSQGKGKVLEVNPNSPAITGISWSLDGTNYTNHGQKFYNVFKNGNNPSRTVWLKTQNVCGESFMTKSVWFDNNDYNDFYEVNAKLPDLFAFEVEVYPNPSTSDWTLKLPKAAIANLELYDVNGRKIWQQSNVQFNAEIPGAELTSGIYLLKIKIEGREESKKLIKQ